MRSAIQPGTPGERISRAGHETQSHGGCSDLLPPCKAITALGKGAETGRDDRAQGAVTRGSNPPPKCITDLL